MGLIPPFFLDCVVAIGVPQEDGKKDWVASGFLMGELVEPLSDGQKRYTTYLATNRHVLEGRKEVILRFNPREMKPAREYNFLLEDVNGKRNWIPHPDPKVDVAVTSIDTSLLRKEGIRFAFFPSDVAIADRKMLLELGVTEGDFVYVIGFPMGLVGGERNYVMVRQGIIARISDALVTGSQEYVLDAFIFPGNSGGPVVTKPELISIEGTRSVPKSYLIGMVRNYISYRDVAISAQTGHPRVVFEENSGLASVIPIDLAREPIQQLLKVDREKRKDSAS